ncbi:MAG: hypothetical protein C0501_03775 [Isosphaera sp.]|nr:hypothetical protein [Isosphaera sp.]
MVWGVVRTGRSRPPTGVERVNTSGPADKAADRFAFLDAVRGLAAVAVVVEHAGELCVPGLAEASHRYFHLGPFLLPLFMLVSGFVIPVSLERGGSNARFWAARFLRLYPLYWVSLALLVPVYRVVPPVTGFDPADGWHWLANLTMCQDLLGVPHANPVFWTLTVEMGFYVFCSLLFAAGLLRRTCLVAGVGVAAFGVAGAALPLGLGHRFPAGYGFLFVSALFGAVCYRVRTGEVPRRHLTRLVAALLVVSAGVAYLNFEYLPRPAGVQGRFTFVGVFAPWVAAFAVFLPLAARPPRLPRVVLGLGAVSYSAYLLHPLVLWLMPTNLPAVAFVAAVTAVTFAAATVTYLVVERPFIRLGQRLARGKRPDRAAAAPAPVLRKAA